MYFVLDLKYKSREEKGSQINWHFNQRKTSEYNFSNEVIHRKYGSHFKPANFSV